MSELTTKADGLTTSIGQPCANQYNNDILSLDLLTRNELSALATYAWPIEKAISIKAEEMTSEGWFYSHPEADPEALTELNRKLNSQDVKNRFEEALLDAMTFGGSVLVMGVEDGLQSYEPVNIDSIQRVHDYRVIDRFYAIPNQQNLKYNLRNPDTYFISNSTEILNQEGTGYGQNLTVHKSRLLRFEGNYLPHQERLSNLGWGQSVIQPVYEAWKDYNQFGAMTLTMVKRLNVLVHSINELGDLIKHGSRDKLKAHLQDVHEQLLVNNTLILDGSVEKAGFQGQNISGLDSLYQEFKENLVAALGVPWSLILERSGRGGLQEGGSNESGNWKRLCANAQKKKLKTPLEKFAWYIINSDDFEFTKEFAYPGEIEFRPLDQPDAKFEAEVGEIRAKTYMLYQQAQLTPEQIQLLEEGDTSGAMALQPADLITQEQAAQKEKDNENSETTKGDANISHSLANEPAAIISAKDVIDALEAGKELLPEEFELIFEAD